MISPDATHQFLSEIIDSIEDGAALFDGDDRLVMFNETYTQYFTLIKDILKPGISFPEMFQALGNRGLYDGPEAGLEDWIAERTNLFVDGARGNEFERVDGRWVRVDYYKLESGGTFIITADISERKRAERELEWARDELEQRIEERTAALRASERRFRDFAVATSDWFWEMDKDLRFSYVSPNVTKILGIPSHSHIGKSRQEILGENYDRELWDEHLQDLQNHEPFRDFVFHRTDVIHGSKWISVSGVPLFDSEGTFSGYRGIGQDITTQHALEAQLSQADKLATLGTLAAGTVHELSQPLNIIRLAVDSILIDKDTNASSVTVEAKELQDIVAQVLRMATIIDHMRVFSRKESNPGAPFVASAVIADVLTLVERQISSTGIHLKRHMPESFGTVLGSSGQLEQVILNLVSNARDAVEAQARRMIEAGKDFQGEIVIELAEQDAENRIAVEISDNGGGIEESLVSNIFDPFFTTKEVGAGTGLGLSVSHTIIHAMGGTLEAENTQTGACFRITLPRAAGLEERPEKTK